VVEGGVGGWEPADGVQVELGSDQLLEGLEEALTGLRAGQEATIETRVPGGPDEGRPARVTVRLQEVLETREPELGDELAAAAGPYASIDELRAMLRRQLDRELSAELVLAARDAALAAVIAATGLDPEPEMSRAAVLDAIADATGTQVTVDELREIVLHEMGRAGVSARTFRKHLAQDGVAVRLYEYARREKALGHLLRSVVLKGARGEVVGFEELTASP
jgi:trigger factor